MRCYAPALLLLSVSTAAQTWTQLPDFPGSERDDAASFTVGERIFVGTGMDAGFQLTNDWYTFDIQTGTWSAIAPLPASPRQYCTAFAAYDTGYVFGGVDANGALNELWAYDPVQNEWHQRNSMPAEARYACAAAIGWNYIIIATGMLQSGVPTDQAWKYYPGTDSWEAMNPMPGPARHRATAFTDSGGMLIAGGVDSLGTVLSDAWSYPVWFETGEWYPAPALPAPRYSAKSAPDNIMVVVGGASSTTAVHNNVWDLYQGDTWFSQPPFPGGPRRGGAIGGVIAGPQSVNRVYFGTGSDNVQRYDDWWVLELVVGAEEAGSASAFSLSPTLTDGGIIIRIPSNAAPADVTITDLTGRLMMSAPSSTGSVEVLTSDWRAGAYVATMQCNAGRSSQRFVVVH